jgi:large conductance mechanosensitive channel
MKNFIFEFKKFALKGNVIDLAVAVVVGGAFGKIVSSLVTDIITPFLGLILGNINLAGVMAGPFAFGDLIETTIDFIIIALVVFLAVKFINLLHKKQDTAPITPIPSKEEQLLTEIRDILSRQ